MLKTSLAAALGVQLLLCPTPTKAAYLPIESELFTIESTPGIGEWAGNSLTLDLSVGGPLFGGYVQTGLISRTELPANIIGVAFDISSTLTNPRVSFGWLVYDASGHGQGQKNLNNYIGGSWDFTTWYAQIEGGSSSTNVFLGAAYSPFGLEEAFLHDHPLVSLDFRADGWNGTEYLPGIVSFDNIRWVVTPPKPEPLPSPQSLLLFLVGVIGAAAWRRKVTL
jgi:hypothetical protein